MPQPRVVLADDHTLLVDAFRKLLEPHCNIVGTVSDGLALLKAVRELKPDVAVIDIAMPLLSGLEAGHRIKLMTPAVKLVYLTMNEDPDLAVEAMHGRASAYLLKSSAASELFQAIQIALKGGTYVTPQIAKGMQDIFVRDPEGKGIAKKLTPRQREVLQLLAEGKSMKEAGAILELTPRTIAFHKYRMMEQLGIKTSADLVHYAIKNRILVA